MAWPRASGRTYAGGVSSAELSPSAGGIGGGLSADELGMSCALSLGMDELLAAGSFFVRPRSLSRSPMGVASLGD